MNRRGHARSEQLDRSRFLDTRGKDINIAPPSSIVDPDTIGRSRFIGQAASATARGELR
jgi:hypothetical protein